MKNFIDNRRSKERLMTRINPRRCRQLKLAEWPFGPQRPLAAWRLSKREAPSATILYRRSITYL